MAEATAITTEDEEFLRQVAEPHLVHDASEVSEWQREWMCEQNQRRWDLCVLCHHPSRGSEWTVPLLHKFDLASIGPEGDDLPVAFAQHRFDRATVPVCEQCKRLVLPCPHIQRSAAWRITLLSWLVGWHWTIWEVRTMPAPYLAKYLDFLMGKVPDYIDTRSLTT